MNAVLTRVSLTLIFLLLRFHFTTSCCYSFTTVLLLSPCHRQDTLLTPSMKRQCDVFTHVALLEASKSVNLDLRSQCRFTFTSPAFSSLTAGEKENLPDTLANAVRQIVDVGRLPIYGMVGPYDPSLSQIVNYVIGNAINRVSISYSQLDDELLSNSELYPYLYSTVASSEFLNSVRLKLLYDFSWRRVAIVATDDPYNAVTAEKFLKLTRENSTMKVILPSTIHSDPEAVLKYFKDDDYRIFVGFFPEEMTRHIICKAINLNLTTDRHVWILPGVYDYEWWKDSSCYPTTGGLDTCNECDEDEMREAIQGIIFVDSSNANAFTSPEERVDLYERFFKYVLPNDSDSPTQRFNTTIAPYIDEDEQYFIHSRAANAYDAVQLLGQAFKKALSILRDTSATCKNVRQKIASIELTEIMVDVLNDHVYCGLSGCYHLSRNRTYDFSQAKITQFYDDSECIIGLYHNYLAPESYVPFQFQRFNDTFSFLPNSTSSLIFSNYTLLNASILFSYSCPYRWKSGDNYSNVSWTAPTDGACHDKSCLCYNQIITEVVFSISVSITLIGILIGFVLLLVNCLLRKNKHFKASSPKFNVVIIVGCMIMFVSITFVAFSFSGNLIFTEEDVLKVALPTFCELDKWFFYIGMSLVLATMLSRNWRIYRIFYNPKIEERNYLTDKVLCVIIISLTVPVCILLIAWTAADHYQLHKHVVLAKCLGKEHLDDSIKTYEITYTCTSSECQRWRDIVLILYNVLMSCVLIFLSLQNSKIKTHIAQEGEFAARAVFVIFLCITPTIFLKIVDLIIPNINSLSVFWIKLLFLVIFPSVILGGLFIPKFHFLLKDYRKNKRQPPIASTGYSCTVHLEYEEKLKEIATLRSQLKERENSIISLQGQLYTACTKL